jgi:hypothetical protein
MIYGIASRSRSYEKTAHVIKDRVINDSKTYCGVYMAEKDIRDVLPIGIRLCKKCEKEVMQG